jgi:hypothetical protein
MVTIGIYFFNASEWIQLDSCSVTVAERIAWLGIIQPLKGGGLNKLAVLRAGW